MTASNEILNQSSEAASEEAAWKKLRQYINNSRILVELNDDHIVLDRK